MWDLTLNNMNENNNFGNSEPNTMAMAVNRLSEYGLVIRGDFVPHRSDNIPFVSKGVETRSVLLVGNINRRMWQVFQSSEIYKFKSDRHTQEPLDQWTRDVVGQVAGELSARAIYPFDGPPYFPFLKWAHRAEPVSTSPLGLTIHPTYGLWHAYRAALLFADPIQFPRQSEVESPCHSCTDQPCLSGCPVGAFSEGRYDLPKCIAHLTSSEDIECKKKGCLARHACPVGTSYVYGSEQAQFHMDAFVKSVVEQD
jgi:hypothetical protein